jgi:GNAT superfamily N-acetyltransferase
MQITITAETREVEPVKKPCSLLGECIIEDGESADYKKLAGYHYRDTGFPPGVHHIYRARHAASGKTVGVIVYAVPALNLAVRNKIFGDRYKIGGSVATNVPRSQRLNAEMELIIRVVVHPTFRGTGLGRRIVAETLPLRPYRYIEASAAMGNINPFFERAGMTPVQVSKTELTVRVLGALRSFGMTDEEIANWRAIVDKLESLQEEKRAWLWKELERYATRWLKSRTGRKIHITPELAARRVAANALIQTTYFIYENKHLAPKAN